MHNARSLGYHKYYGGQIAPKSTGPPQVHSYNKITGRGAFESGTTQRAVLMRGIQIRKMRVQMLQRSHNLLPLALVDSQYGPATRCGAGATPPQGALPGVDSHSDQPVSGGPLVPVRLPATYISTAPSTASLHCPPISYSARLELDTWCNTPPEASLYSPFHSLLRVQSELDAFLRGAN